MPDKRTRHGLRTMMIAIKTRDMRALDRRCAGAKALMQWKSELIAALGGVENVSPQKMALIDAVTRSKLYVDHLDSWLLSQGCLINGRKRAIVPALAQRQTLVDGMARILTSLGLERQAKPVPTLEAFIAQVEKEKEPA